MITKNQRLSISTSVLLILLLNNSFAQNYKWHTAGSIPDKYKMGGNPEQNHLAGSLGFLKSIESEINGFGTYMTSIIPGDYLGKRIIYSAYVKSENVNSWAGLWMRTDSKKQSCLTFDNMQNRSIQGTNDWKKYEVVLDIPDSTTHISFGLLLAGTGKVYFDAVLLEVTNNTKAVTQFNPVADKKE